MQEVTYYICDICGRQSRSKGGTKNHERVCIRKKEDEQKELEYCKKIQYKFLESITSPEEVHIKVMEWMKKWNNINLEIRQDNLMYDDKVSNSHNCPINGVTNWHGSEEKPSGYPGWTAHWIIGMSNKIRKKTHFSDLFESYPWQNEKIYSTILGVHTSSGGVWYRSDNDKQEEVYIHYYMSFFADDFPGLQKWLLIKELKKETR